MKFLIELLKILLLSLGAVALGGLVGTGVASPEVGPIIPMLAAASCILIAFVSPPAVLAVLLVAAPIATFAHLDLRLAQSVPSISLTRLSASFLILLMLLQINTGRRALPKIKALDLVLLAAIAGIALSVTRSIELVRSAQVFFDSYFIPFLMFFLAKHMVRDFLWLKRIMFALVIVGVYLAALTTHEMLTGEGLLVPAGDLAYRYSVHLGRSTVVFGNSAISGALLAVIFPITLIIFMNASLTLHKALLAIALVVIAVGLFFTYTRAAWLTSFLSLLALQYFYPGLRRLLLPILALAAVAAVLFWGQLSASTLFLERIASQGPIEGRSSMLELGVQFFQQNPVLGIGFDNFRQITKLWNMTDIENTHNSFLFILVSAGLVGFLPYLTAIVLIIKETISQTRWLASAGHRSLMAPLGVATIAYLGNSLVIDIVSAPYLSMVFFIIAGCHLGLADRLRSSRRQSEEELLWSRASPARASV